MYRVCDTGPTLIYKLLNEIGIENTLAKFLSGGTIDMVYECRIPYCLNARNQVVGTSPRCRDNDFTGWLVHFYQI